MAEERQGYDVPPTRPSTPILRAPRIAEAPSRAEPNPPLMETSSPPHATTAVMAFDQRDGVNGDMTQDIEDRSDPAPSVSPSIHFLDAYPLLPVGNRAAFPLSSWLQWRRSASFITDCAKVFQNLPLSPNLHFKFLGQKLSSENP
jgi:hypothetical protein